MLTALLIMLREGFEAALVVAIVYAYIRRIGRRDLVVSMWQGMAAAAVLSVAVGVVIHLTVENLTGRPRLLAFAAVSLLAVVVLTWMIFWMRRQGARIKSELQEKVDTALVTGGLALAGLAFFAVLREGVETALFLYAAAKGTAVEGTDVAPAAQVIGAILGLVLAVILGALLYRGGIRMNLRSFFRVTGLLLIVVAAGLFAFSLHELQEAGWLPLLDTHAFDITSTLPDDAGVGAILHGLIGYHADPTWLEVLGWTAYLAVVGGLFLRRPKTPGEKSRPEHEASTTASSHAGTDASH